MKQTDIQTALNSIRVLRSMLSTNQWEPVRKELEFAINEMKKCIPTKPIREAWSPNTCPNCGADLGRYDAKEDAIMARLTKEIELYREFAPQKALLGTLSLCSNGTLA